MLTREERFWKKVDKNGPLILDTSCWVWIGYLTNEGYGQFWNGTKLSLAHRYSWELHNETPPQDYFVCHKCDNPSCVNPEHLFLGSCYDNMQDMIAKKRDYHNKKLTDDQALQIYNSVNPAKDLAKDYNVHVGTIHEIKRGVTYKKVTKHQFKKVGKGRRKLTDEQVVLIFNSSKTSRQISEEFKITPEMVLCIKKGKCHTKITGYSHD